MIRISRAKHPRRRKVFSQCKTSAASEGVPAGGSLAVSQSQFTQLGITRTEASYGKSAMRRCVQLYNWAGFLDMQGVEAGGCTAAQVLTGKWEQADLLPEDGPRAQFDARNDFLAEFSGESSRLS